MYSFWFARNYIMKHLIGSLRYDTIIFSFDKNAISDIFQVTNKLFECVIFNQSNVHTADLEWPNNKKVHYTLTRKANDIVCIYRCSSLRSGTFYRWYIGNMKPLFCFEPRFIQRCTKKCHHLFNEYRFWTYHIYFIYRWTWDKCSWLPRWWLTKELYSWEWMVVEIMWYGQ